jgi:hypothetical protein
VQNAHAKIEPDSIASKACWGDNETWRMIVRFPRASLGTYHQALLSKKKRTRIVSAWGMKTVRLRFSPEVRYISDVP